MDDQTRKLFPRAAALIAGSGSSTPALPVQLRHAVGSNPHDPNCWITADDNLAKDLNELGLRGENIETLFKSLGEGNWCLHHDTSRYMARYSALSAKIAELRPDLVPGRRAASSWPSLRDRLPSHLRPAYAQASAEERELHAARQAQLEDHHERSHWRTLRSAAFALAYRKWPHRDFGVDLNRFMQSWTPGELARVEARSEWIDENAREFVRVLEKWLAGNYKETARKVIAHPREVLAAQLERSRAGGALGR